VIFPFAVKIIGAVLLWMDAPGYLLVVYGARRGVADCADAETLRVTARTKADAALAVRKRPHARGGRAGRRAGGR
jgi:hypothetical protein